MVSSSIDRKITDFKSVVKKYSDVSKVFQKNERKYLTNFR
jgi:hypothetical protein